MVCLPGCTTDRSCDWKLHRMEIVFVCVEHSTRLQWFYRGYEAVVQFHSGRVDRRNRYLKMYEMVKSVRIDQKRKFWAFRWYPYRPNPIPDGQDMTIIVQLISRMYHTMNTLRGVFMVWRQMSAVFNSCGGWGFDPGCRMFRWACKGWPSFRLGSNMRP
jgi:hypothetical protein